MNNTIYVGFAVLFMLFQCVAAVACVACWLTVAYARVTRAGARLWLETRRRTALHRLAPHH